jgi:glutathione S-transferase
VFVCRRDRGFALVAAEKEVLTMLTVRTSLGSPFGRKVRLAVSLLGLDGRIAIEPASTQDEADPIRKQNPLGKVPVLILDDGGAIFDSPVILEYLDVLAGGGKIIPKETKARFDALRLEALADGILDASILLVYEGRFRPPDKHVQKWIDMQAAKVARALTALEAAPPKLDALPLDALPNVGQITLACVLGYGDFRFEGRWRKDHPRLVAWLDAFAAKVPAFAATMPPPG